ncbi:CotH kinase family protein [Streptomyces sp. ACA25]|uniref:CotH kinase family protein n=1 Tax=Streptomyces sp. ACA25 TaxID=3022596 RepID=UPI002306F9E9|nr:CotH kinase family protein [Streptomyces sp. ACA25]MDB1089047.1 CotH kinase family protein [Streptomyces sp. ACA25]
MASFTGAGADPAPPSGIPSEAAASAVGPSTVATAATDEASSAAADDLTGDITFSVPSGTFQGQMSVSLSTQVNNAEIRYTTNGELPTASSQVYSGSPLQFTTTTQLRAQAFASGQAAGDPGTAVYIAHSFDATHDMPLLVMDAYGGGKPGRQYEDVATMIMEPQAGTTSISADPAVATRAGFRLRGQSSSEFPKAPYRLELWNNNDKDAAYPVLGMPAEADWVLRGPFTDKALIRDALVFDLGRAMGLAAPRYEFVELYLNLDGQPMGSDDYQGVYMLTETVKDGPDRLDIAKLGKNDTQHPEVTGGYLFKFEWFAADEPILRCPGAPANCWQDLEVKRPKTLQPEQETYLAQYLLEFSNALRGPNPSDPQTGYPAYIDVDSFVDMIIIHELSRDMDAYIRSAYYHKDRGEKLVAGPLWDYDLTFGTGGYFNNTHAHGWQFEQVRQPIANDWVNRLMDDPSFQQRVDSRWRELRQGVLSNSQLEQRINQLSAPLANGAQRNFQKWPNLTDWMVGPFITPTANTWQGQVQYLRDWTFQRAAWLDSSGWRPTGGVARAPE